MDEDRYGSWLVRWGPDRFSIRNSAETARRVFHFLRIVLPIELVVDPAREKGYAVLKIDSHLTEEVLPGTSQLELARFKRRLSAEVFAAARQTPFGCSDCASEAGMASLTWDGSVCPGCRENYCRSARCLRRLRVVVLQDGRRVCRYCGTDNGQIVPLDFRAPVR